MFMAHPVRVNNIDSFLDGTAYLGGGVNLMHIFNVLCVFYVLFWRWIPDSGRGIWNSRRGGG